MSEDSQSGPSPDLAAYSLSTNPVSPPPPPPPGSDTAHGITICYHLWISWTLTNIWESRRNPDIAAVAEHFINTEIYTAAAAVLWSLSAKKYKELTEGAHGPAVDLEDQDAPAYIAENIEKWLDDFVRGPRGRRALPPFPRDSESQREAQRRAFLAPAIPTIVVQNNRVGQGARAIFGTDTSQPRFNLSVSGNEVGPDSTMAAGVFSAETIQALLGNS